MTLAGTSGVHRTAGGTSAVRKPRVMPRLLRGGAAGIAGVLLTASPTWGAGMDISHQFRYASDDRARTHGSPAPRDDGPQGPRDDGPRETRESQPGADGADGAPEHGDAGDPADPSVRREPADRWAHPVAEARVSAAYGVPGGWLAGHHTGVDFAVPVGTPVRSAGPGEIVGAGWGGDYGHLVTVRTEEGQYLLFAHLSRIAVTPGQKVGPGDLLGHSGNTGRSSGPHLHFEVRQSLEYGSDINPQSYLASKGVQL